MGAVVLRPDARRVPTRTGVRFHTAEGVFDIPGESIAGWVDALAPFLDGSRSETDVLTMLPENHRATGARVLAALRSRRITRTVPVSTVDDQDESALLSYYLDDPGAASAIARTAVVAVLGDGPLLEPVLDALRGAGLRGTRRCDTVPAEAGVVVHLATADSLPAHDPEHCPTDVRLAAAVVDADAVWWLPTRAGADSPGMVELWRRRTATRGAPTAPRPDPDATGYHVAAAQLARDVLGALTGLPPVYPPDRVLRLDLATLGTEPYGYPHVPAELPPPDAPFAMRVLPLQGNGFGAFTDIDVRPAEGVPLYLARTTVADPHGPTGPHRTVVGIGTDPVSAWERAARRAIVRYALATVDTSSAPGVTGADVLDGTERAVPGELVYSAEARPCGAALGSTEHEALSAGLVQHVRRLVAAALPGARLRPIGLADAPLDSAGAYLLSLAGALAEVRALDATPILGVPAVYCAAGGVRALGAGRSVTAAFGCALQRLVAAQHGLATERVPEVAEAPGTAEPSGRVLGVADIAGALTGHGRPVAVHIGQDSVLRALAPHLLRVVLLDG